MSEYFVHIEHGLITNEVTVSKCLDELKKKDGWYKLKTERGKKRTNPQNRYYFGCLLPLAVHGFREIGYDEVEEPEDAHEIFKSLFLKCHHENKEGLVIEYTGSTRKLSTVQFEEYMEKCRKFCAENLYTPIPNPGKPLLIDYKR